MWKNLLVVLQQTYWIIEPLIEFDVFRENCSLSLFTHVEIMIHFRGRMAKWWPLWAFQCMRKCYVCNMCVYTVHVTTSLVSFVFLCDTKRKVASRVLHCKCEIPFEFVLNFTLATKTKKKDLQIVCISNILFGSTTHRPSNVCKICIKYAFRRVNMWYNIICTSILLQ